MKKAFIVTTILLIIGAIIVGILHPNYQLDKLDQAWSLTEEGKLEEAKEIFDGFSTVKTGYGQCNVQDTWAEYLDEAHTQRYIENFEAGNYKLLLSMRDGDLPYMPEYLAKIYAADGEAKETKKKYEMAAKAFSQATVYAEEAGIDASVYQKSYRRCCYARGKVLFQKKSYLKAKDWFEKSDGYKDAATWLKKCSYHYGIVQLNKGHNDVAYDAFVDAEDYKQAEKYRSFTLAKIAAVDKHYGRAYRYLQEIPKSFQPAKKYRNKKWYKLLDNLNGTSWLGSRQVDGHTMYYRLDFDEDILKYDVESWRNPWDGFFFKDYAFGQKFDMESMYSQKGVLIVYEEDTYSGTPKVVEVIRYTGETLKIRVTDYSAFTLTLYPRNEVADSMWDNREIYVPKPSYNRDEEDVEEEKEEKDPYNAPDYGYVEDFIDDWGDEFYTDEDAEEYLYDHD